MPLDYWNKVHLCGLLSVRFGLRRYLEISTGTTGFRYAEARQLGFDSCVRLVYRHCGPLKDGLPIDFASPDDSIAAPLAAIERAGLSFDLVFVDPHHTYECSARDIRTAFKLVPRGGAVVIHDCLPPTREIASPTQVPDFWCGVTYKAYLDFVLGNPGLDYVTLDADLGCGVIFKPRSPIDRLACVVRTRRPSVRALHDRWHACGQDYDRCFDELQRETVALLRLVNFAGLRRKLR